MCLLTGQPSGKVQQTITIMPDIFGSTLFTARKAGVVGSSHGLLSETPVTDAFWPTAAAFSQSIQYRLLNMTTGFPLHM